MCKRILFLLLIGFFLLFVNFMPNRQFQSAAAKSSSHDQSVHVTDHHISSSLQNFLIENKGQWSEEILFSGKTSFGSIIFCKDAVYYQLKDSKEDKVENSYQSIIKMSFENSNRPIIQGLEKLSSQTNYFSQTNQTLQKFSCQNFKRVIYNEIYNGIDLHYYYSDKGLKYEFIVKPGAESKSIHIKVEGAEVINHKNKLELKTPLGSLFDKELYVYGKTSSRSIPSHFSSTNHSYSFQIEQKVQQPEETIIIDPLLFCTYEGGNNEEKNYSLAIDSQGCSYVTGYTTSSDFPDPLLPGYQKTSQGESDAFVLKLNSTGSALLYATYVGGSDNDFGQSITVDSAGAAYITGYTMSTDFPTDPAVPGFQKENNGLSDAFIVKINSTGTDLVYSTYLGGSNYDYGQSIKVDSMGCSYITGSTLSSDFPTDPQVLGYQKTYQGNYDAFVVKINSQGTALDYATYIGGEENDLGCSIALDSLNNAYVTGWTESPDFPTSPGVPGFQKTYQGSSDAFVVKINISATGLDYSSYVGGTNNDYGYSIAVDSQFNLYVAGWTTSEDFPTNENLPGYQKSNSGSSDAFVVKLNPQNSSLIYATYLGGMSTEVCYSIAVDSQYCAHLTGYTDSFDFPTNSQLAGFQKVNNGIIDAFIAKLNPWGDELMYSSYLGGTNYDYGKTIVVDTQDAVYITGFSSSIDFPTSPTVPGFQKENNGKRESFLVKMTSNLPSPQLLTPPDLTEINMSAPVFTWDPIPYAVSYHLTIENITTPNPLIVYENANILTLSHQIPLGILQCSSNYRWSLQGVNAEGSGLWASSEFTTYVVTPPALGLPADEATDVPLEPTLSWQAVTGATTYHLIIENISGAIPVIVFASSVIPTAFFQVPANILLEDTDYRWTVRASVGADCWSMWSVPFTFST